jgi:16S rRNA (guanine1207-N2)-methyltransferase
MEKNGFSLQRVKFVYFSEGRDANLVLVEAQKGKKCKFTVEEPLFLEKYNGV